MPGGKFVDQVAYLRVLQPHPCVSADSLHIVSRGGIVRHAERFPAMG
jgi:hypothetical protein